MTTHSITVDNAQQFGTVLDGLKRWGMARVTAGRRFRVKVAEEKRSNDQNSLMWALLGEVSRQVVWHGQKLTDKEWKDVFTASLKRQKVVPGLDGGFVVLGSSTSQMDKEEFSPLIDLIQAFGAQQGVTFREQQ